MANLLKVNVTVAKLAEVHQLAHQLKDLAQHLKFENSQIEITVAPGSLPGAVVTQAQLDDLGEKMKTLTGAVKAFDETIPEP